MSDKIENPSAFPQTHVPTTVDAEGWDGDSGMTLRDYFAAAIVSGALRNDHLAAKWTQNTNDLYGVIARASYGIADAMLKARQS